MALRCNIAVPSAVSSLGFASVDSLWAGSGQSSQPVSQNKLVLTAVLMADDGTLRLYNLPSPKVVRAIKSLGHDIACIVVSAAAEGDIWIASGRKVRIAIFLA